VKRAANSGIDDEGKLEVKAELKETMGEFWWDCSQANPILIEERPMFVRDPSV
jgi:hypothetical protein